MSGPTSFYFLQKFLTQYNLPEYVNSMALVSSARSTSQLVTLFASQYLVHLTLLSGEIFLKYHPSEVAAASVLLAANSVGLMHLVPHKFMDSFVGTTVEASGIDHDEVKARQLMCMDEIVEVHKAAADSQQRAVYQKFSEHK